MSHGAHVIASQQCVGCLCVLATALIGVAGCARSRSPLRSPPKPVMPVVEMNALFEWSTPSVEPGTGTSVVVAGCGTFPAIQAALWRYLESRAWEGDVRRGLTEGLRSGEWSMLVTTRTGAMRRLRLDVRASGGDIQACGRWRFVADGGCATGGLITSAQTDVHTLAPSNGTGLFEYQLERLTACGALVGFAGAHRLVAGKSHGYAWRKSMNSEVIFEDWNCVNGVIEGVSREWFRDGSVIQIEFSGGVEDGPRLGWNGVTGGVSIGHMKRGMRHGLVLNLDGRGRILYLAMAERDEPAYVLFEEQRE